MQAFTDPSLCLPPHLIYHFDDGIVMEHFPLFSLLHHAH